MHLSTKARTGQCHIPVNRVQALLCEPENHKSSRTFLLSFARDIFQEKFNVVKPVKKKKKSWPAKTFFLIFSMHYHSASFSEEKPWNHCWLFPYLYSFYSIYILSIVTFSHFLKKITIFPFPKSLSVTQLSNSPLSQNNRRYVFNYCKGQSIVKYFIYLVSFTPPNIQWAR